MATKKIAKEAVQTPKGTHDILPADQAYWDYLEEITRSVARFYGFKEIRTPHIEKTEIFMHTLGETTDIIEKQMYSFRTRGGDSLTMRPEGTAPIARAYIQHGMNSWPQPVRLYYSGSFFRHENPQRGRMREFNQFGLEVLGEDDPIADALIIRLFYTMLTELGFKNVALEVNSIGDEESRAAYRKELISFYRKRVNSLCKDCKRRLKENTLRLLDCKESICVEIREEAPQIIKSLGDASRKRFKALLEYLEEADIPYFLNPHLVRGLDYYTDTVFEMFINYPEEDASSTNKEIEEKNESYQKPSPIAVASGGRYDGLVKILGGKQTPAVGGAMGMDRVILEMKTAGISGKDELAPDVFLVQLGPAAKKKTFMLLEEFRKAGMQVGESVGKDSIKSQLKIASKLNARYALILGQREALDGTVIMREMSTGVQETVFIKDIINNIKIKLKKK